MIVNFKISNNSAHARENNYNVQQKKVELGIQKYEYDEMDYSKYDPMSNNSHDVITQRKIEIKKQQHDKFKKRVDEEVPKLLEFYQNCDINDSDKEYILSILNNMNTLLSARDYYDISNLLNQLTLYKNQYETNEVLNGSNQTANLVDMMCVMMNTYYYGISYETQKATVDRINKYYEILEKGDVEAAKTYYQDTVDFYNNTVKPEITKVMDTNKKDYTYKHKGNGVASFFEDISKGYNWAIDKISDGMYYVGDKTHLNDVWVESPVGKFITGEISAAYNFSQEINKQTFSMLEGVIDTIAYAAGGSKAKSFIAYDFTSNLLNSFNSGGMYSEMADSNVNKLLAHDSMLVSLAGGAYRCTAGIAIGQAIGGDAILALGNAKISSAAFITSSLFGMETFGQTLQGEYNKNKVELSVNGNAIKLNIDYSTYKKAKTLEEGKKIELTRFPIKDENGNNIVVTLTIERINGKYNVYDQFGNTYDLESLKERSDGGAEVKSLLYGAFEVAQWWTAAKINNVGKVALDGQLVDTADHVIRNVFSRVGLDILDGAIEVPIRTGIDWATDRDLTFTEAWQGQGGWKSLFYQAALGGIMSFGSEYLTNKQFRTALQKEIDIFLKDNNGFLKLGASDSKIDITDGDSIIKYVNENAINLSAQEKDKFIDELIKSGTLDLENVPKFSNGKLAELLTSDSYIGKELLSNDEVFPRIQYLFEQNPDKVNKLSGLLFKQIDSVDVLDKYLSIPCVSAWIDEVDTSAFYEHLIAGTKLQNSALESPIVRERFKKLSMDSSQLVVYRNEDVRLYIKNHKEQFAEFFDFYKNIDSSIKNLNYEQQFTILRYKSNLSDVLDDVDYNKLKSVEAKYNSIIDETMMSFPGINAEYGKYKIDISNSPDCASYDLAVVKNGKSEVRTVNKHSFSESEGITFYIDEADKAAILAGEFKIENVTPNYDKSKLLIPVETGKTYQIDIEYNGHEQTIYRKDNLFNYVDLSEFDSSISKVLSVKEVETVNFQNTVQTFNIDNAMPGAKVLLEDGHYGGDQSDVPRIYRNPTNAIELEKKELFESITRKYMENATEADMLKLTETYANRGCNYMAAANAVTLYFSSLENGAEEFAKRFGYDLNITSGQMSATNVEAIAYELFLYKLKNENGNISSGIIASGRGLNRNDYSDIVPRFFKEKQVSLNRGLDACDYLSGATEFQSVIENINANKDTFMILHANKFDLELVGNGFDSMSADEALKNSSVSGNKVNNIGSHAMLITGADSNNILTVSSWSNKYKFDLNSIDAIKKNNGSVLINPFKLSLIEK